MLPRGAGSKIIVGFDLGEENSQISFYGAGNKNVETVSAVAGVEEYNIPTVLCKREGNGQWFYGREALRVANEENGILVDHLLSHAMDGEPVWWMEKPMSRPHFYPYFSKKAWAFWPEWEGRTGSALFW